MNLRRHRILVSTFGFHSYEICHCGHLALQKLAIFQYNAEMVMVVVFIIRKCRVNSRRICWQNEQYGVFLEYTLLDHIWSLIFLSSLG
jgi:ATP sulfurylase